MPKKNDFFTNLSIDEEKLKLIKFYCAERGETTEIEKDIAAIINNRIDTLYKKKVPKDVRHFLENKDKINSGKVNAERTTTPIEEREVITDGSERETI
ncbi:MAG: hypothetical protein J6A69_11220 [Clostridia bacterium]|nr:hypothetical protein [Clostridia bacterium]